MHIDPKKDAQKVEDAGLTAQPVEAELFDEGVAKLDEPSIEAAQKREREEKERAEKELRERKEREASSPRSAKQDKLDLERASGEGMTAPLSHP